MNRRFLVTVIVNDRVGVIRDVSGALFKAGGNLADLRQMVIDGVFTFHCIAEFMDAADPAAIRAAVRAAVPDADAEVSVRAVNPVPVTVAPNGGRYVAAISGPDRPGRINQITTLFADRGVNVEGWRHDLSDPSRALTIGVVTVPAGCDVAVLQKELRAALMPFGLRTSLRHENIFRATNEVGPIDALLGE